MRITSKNTSISDELFSRLIDGASSSRNSRRARARNHRAAPSSAHQFSFQLVERFRDEAERCATADALRHLLEEASRDLGFRYFALLHHASLRSAASTLIRIDNYPSEWEAELRASQWTDEDPVHRASIRTNSGFAWSDLGELIALSSNQRQILESSARFGIGPGFTAPANVPGEPHGSCSFAVRRGARLPVRNLLSAELIGAHAFRAARRIQNYAGRRDCPHLSRRELQCLRLVAQGKSDWEVARILGLSPETTRQYLKRARAAYDVVSRTQLVVCGLRDAIITFDDAIPPA